MDFVQKKKYYTSIPILVAQFDSDVIFDIIDAIINNVTHSPLTYSLQTYFNLSMESYRMLQKYVGQKIRELRKEKDLTQEGLSLITELDRTYIASVEVGNRNISIKNLEKIARALDISLSDFFGDYDGKQHE